MTADEKIHKFYKMTNLERAEVVFRKLTKIRDRMYAWGMDNHGRLHNYPAERATFELNEKFVNEICSKVPLNQVNKNQMEKLNAIWHAYKLQNQSANGNK